MSSSIDNPSLSEDQSSYPVVHISYECVGRERTRDSTTYLYEIACSITYRAISGHVSVRVTGQNTYRNAAARDVPFTRHAAGATTYLELLDAEQLEVRVVEEGGDYCKAIYYAHRQKLIEQSARRVISTIQRIDSPSDSVQNGNVE
jgi:hypothetical protein